MTTKNHTKLRQLYQELDDIFTDSEAWVLFRWSAFLETFGWALLLVGILFQIMKWPGEEWLLPVGGSLHGTFVLGYMFIVFFAHRSFTPKWSMARMCLAELISIVPFGALMFEMWMARQRKMATSQS